MSQSTKLIMLSVLLAGCTSISITATDGMTKIERSFGFATVSVSPGKTPILVEVTAFGITSGPAGFALGLSKQQLAAIPATCKAVFWIKNESEAKALQAIISGREEFCSLVSNPKEDNK